MTRCPGALDPLAGPGIPGENAAGRPALRRVVSRPGIRAVLVITLLVLTGHQLTYTLTVTALVVAAACRHRFPVTHRLP
jgi:predicted MFS family arabinose efflux permease